MNSSVLENLAGFQSLHHKITPVISLRWMTSYARTRNERTMRERLAGEIMDAVNGAGGAAKKRSIPNHVPFPLIPSTGRINA